MVNNNDIKGEKCFKIYGLGLFAALLSLMIVSCTTQDFEYAGKNEDVYRVKLENIGNAAVTYDSQVSIFYIDYSDSLHSPGSRTITPDDPVQLIRESEPGVYGISANIFIKKIASNLKLTVEKGTGTGQNFVLDKVVAEKESIYNIGIRIGEVQ